jgi:predicted transcriptional regulator
MESPYPPWILTEQAPDWVVTAVKEEDWPESAVSHLLKRLLSEGVVQIRLTGRAGGVPTLELASATGDWPSAETAQELDATSSRPVDEAIKRALDVISRRRADAS